jgi:hypothetical protein
MNLGNIRPFHDISQTFCIGVESVMGLLEVEKTSSKNEPTCRVCGRPMVLLDEDAQRWYCDEDDQLWLGTEQKWVGRVTEIEKRIPEQAQGVKYCKKCGNTLDVADTFCDKCGAEQKRTLTLPQIRNQVRSQPQLKRTANPAKPTDLWYALPIFLGILGGIIGYVAVKDEDEELAIRLLIVGVVLFIVCALFLLLLL